MQENLRSLGSSRLKRNLGILKRGILKSTHPIESFGKIFHAQVFGFSFPSNSKGYLHFPQILPNGENIFSRSCEVKIYLLFLDRTRNCSCSLVVVVSFRAFARRFPEWVLDVVVSFPLWCRCSHPQTEIPSLTYGSSIAFIKSARTWASSCSQ